jgi:hypothetical protein
MQDGESEVYSRRVLFGDAVVDEGVSSG